MKKPTIYMFLVVLPLYANGQAIDYKTLENVYYYDSQTADAPVYMKEKNRLDICYPKADHKVPVVIWFHGGGLTSGQKEIPAALKDKGLCVVGAGYRLSPKINGYHFSPDSIM